MVPPGPPTCPTHQVKNAVESLPGRLKCRAAAGMQGYYKGKIDPTQLVLHQGGVLYVKNPAHPGTGAPPLHLLHDLHLGVHPCMSACYCSLLHASPACHPAHMHAGSAPCSVEARMCRRVLNILRDPEGPPASHTPSTCMAECEHGRLDFFSRVRTTGCASMGQLFRGYPARSQAAPAAQEMAGSTRCLNSAGGRQLSQSDCSSMLAHPLQWMTPTTP